MGPGQDNLPLDARLLSDAVIELNISRRNVSIYPKGHPSVDRSLERAFENLRKLFELRPEITLAIAKDTLIVDENYLDKQNPVYREFALVLNGLNIACVSFVQGLTQDELYAFQKLLCINPSEATKNDVDAYLKEHKFVHLRFDFVDYDAFVFKKKGAGEGDEEDGLAGLGPGKGRHIWERYVYGLLHDQLLTSEPADALRQLSPRMLAEFIEDAPPELIREETYDRVITSYMRRTSGRAFSPGDMKKILDFINQLRPELKKDFLRSAVGQVAHSPEEAEKALQEVSADEVIELLTLINEQKLVIPESLNNLLVKFSRHPSLNFPEQTAGRDLLVDDVFLPPGVVDLLESGDFEAYVTGEYQKEIRTIIKADAQRYYGSLQRGDLTECTDEFFEICYAQILMELFLVGILEEDDYEHHLRSLENIAQGLLETGQYLEIIKLLTVLTRPDVQGRMPKRCIGLVNDFFSPEFIGAVVASFRLVGRSTREEALALCEYYGDVMIPPLLDAIVGEDVAIVRRFLLGLVINYGEEAEPEAAKRLNDSRWYVIRNMLYILGEIGAQGCNVKIRPYCRHENPRVAMEALRALLRLKDPYGIGATRRLIRSESEDLVKQGISLAKTFRLKELVGELTTVLTKQGTGGGSRSLKLAVVRALGDIGDPESISTLREIVTARSMLFKTQDDVVKRAIYGTLENYPYAAVADLVALGIRSRDEVIRVESMRLQEKASGNRSQTLDE